MEHGYTENQRRGYIYAFAAKVQEEKHWLLLAGFSQTVALGLIKQALEGQISESTVIVPRWGGSQEYLKAAIEKAKNCTEG